MTSAELIKFLSLMKNPREEVRIARRGIKPIVLKSYINEHNLKAEIILDKLKISRSTYFTKVKSKKNLDTSSTEKFLRLVSILELATEIMGKEEAKEWLLREIPSLANEIPLELLDTEPGHKLVEDTLLHIKYGVYA